MTTPGSPSVGVDKRAPNQDTPTALTEELTGATNPHAVNHEDVTREVNKRAQVRVDGIAQAEVEFSSTPVSADDVGAAPAAIVGRVEALEDNVGTVGLRLERGVLVYPTGNGTTAITFAQPFPATPLIVLTIKSASTIADNPEMRATYSGEGPTGFTLHLVRSQATSTTVQWGAIG